MKKINGKISNAIEDNLILYLTKNSSQLEIAISSAVGSKFKYLIYNDCEQNIYSLRTEHCLPENIKITCDKNSVLMLLPIFKAVITTVGHLSPLLGEKYINIIKACISVKIPIIEVPHGLFQWGFNFEDDSQFVHVASNNFGAGFFVPSFADFKINWFGDESVGYPRYRSEKTKKIFCDAIPKFTIITTNTNWYMYDFEHQQLLVQRIFEYAEKNKSELFIWCPHPAEIASKNITAFSLNERPRNILLYGYDKDIYFHSVDTTEELINISEKGISTLSTCLIDYELMGKPVSVFFTKEFSQVFNIFKSYSTFCKYNKISTKSFEKINTGLLKAFDVHAFDKKIKSFCENGLGNNLAKNIIINL